MHRRDVLRWLAVGAGVQCLEGLIPEQVFAVGRFVHGANESLPGAPTLRVLDAHANLTATTAAERIIPASDTPGATDAGVTAFIDRMLADWYTQAERDRVLAGLRELDARASSLHGHDFADCDEADQDALLAAFDDEVTALRRAPGGSGINPNDHWFAMLKYLTVWGYCTSKIAMTETLRTYPPPWRYEACAPRISPSSRSQGSSGSSPSSRARGGSLPVHDHGPHDQAGRS